MKKYLFVLAAAAVLAGGIPAQAQAPQQQEQQATGVTREQLIQNGATESRECRGCFVYNGQLYRPNGANGTYTVSTGDSSIAGPRDDNGGGDSGIEVRPKPSADVRPDGRRDFRLTCPSLKNNPTVENCREYYEPRAR